MMSLRRPLIILAAAIPLVVAGTSAAAASSGTRVPLEFNTNGDCTSGPFPGSPQVNHSFAVIGTNNSGNVTAHVQVFGASANTTYFLDIVQIPGGQGCVVGQYSLTTNAVGQGHVTISEPIDAGTTDAFVLFTGNQGILGFDATPDVTLGS